ncbi:MAG: hypothetical protein J0H11_07895 [Rhizobiales bacterium]|nr:hypothetical protein [Hyphomicrobiales bacterium]
MATPRGILAIEPRRRRVLAIAVIVLLVLVGADFFVEHHGAFGIDGTPGFAAWYGFASAVFFVALALGWASLAAMRGGRRDD